MEEIERVIFETHSIDSREGAIDFEELLRDRTERHRLARRREAEAVSQISDRIAEELEKERSVELLKFRVTQKTTLVANYTNDRKNLISKDADQRVERHTEIASAAEALRAGVRGFTNQKQAFLTIQDEVSDLRVNRAPESLRQMQARYRIAAMSQEQWSHFLLEYQGER